EITHFDIWQTRQSRPGVGSDQAEQSRPMRVGPRLDTWHLPELAEESDLPCESAETKQIDHLVPRQCARIDHPRFSLLFAMQFPSAHPCTPTLTTHAGWTYKKAAALAGRRLRWYPQRDSNPRSSP